MNENSKAPLPLVSPQRTLPMSLLRAREAVMEQFRPLIHKYDISEQQWRVLRVLYELGPLPASILATHACILPPSLTRMIKALHGRGLLDVDKDREDGRRSIVKLTTQGRAFLQDAAPDGAAVYRRIEELVGAEQIEKLLVQLDVFLDAIEGQPPIVR